MFEKAHTQIIKRRPYVSLSVCEGAWAFGNVSVAVCRCVCVG